MMADLKNMLSQAKISSYLNCTGHEECPKFVRDKMAVIEKQCARKRLPAKTTYRIPYLYAGLVPIQVFVRDPNCGGCC